MAYWQKLSYEQQVAKNAMFDSSMAKKKKESKGVKVHNDFDFFEDNYDLESYSHLFIRPAKDFKLKIKSKDKARQVQEIVRHCFIKYKINNVLMNCLVDTIIARAGKGAVTSKLSTSLDLLEWVCCISQGGSLYKKFAKDYFTKKEVHEIINCPNLNLNFLQLLVYGIARGAGADLGIAQRIAMSRIHESMFTHTAKYNLKFDYSKNYFFWKNVIGFFVRNTPKDISQINDLRDYINHRITENANFSISGWSLANMIKKMDDWHRDLARLKKIGSERWNGIDLPNFTYEVKDENDNVISTWTLTQIKDARSLGQEGNAMRHCVFSYRTYCSSGATSIWSLKKDFVRKVTIELSNKNMCIVQARGFANRRTTREEDEVIWKWASAHKIDSDRYY